MVSNHLSIVNLGVFCELFGNYQLIVGLNSPDWVPHGKQSRIMSSIRELGFRRSIMVYTHGSYPWFKPWVRTMGA
jgi:hypothetical protein